MKKLHCRGRRTGNPDTRELIRQSARARFLAHGYQAVSLRSVAGDAGVDVALVSYYFGSKHALFAEALALPADAAQRLPAALAGDLRSLGRRVLAVVLEMWDDPEIGCYVLAVVAASPADQELNRLLSDVVEREIVDPLARRLAGPDARDYAVAFCSQLLGLVISRYLLRLEPAASMSVNEVLDRFGPSLQRALDGATDSEGPAESTMEGTRSSPVAAPDPVPA